ncbi:hypothetical protein [Halpernia frigidisoli]|uniref:Lipoprotein n=1 Tax=Halpernia frigidisoli TaxID=1125876 RepID=A0A1I3E406_9FLAO|nr:hypothetical protein [Halpernia frigidisoli]SFH93599.1 hypothetical protein SAMN05443292_0861 [Halpernia frigidisoli]
MKIINFFFYFTLFSLISCSEIKTNNPTEVYKYWSGTNPNSDVRLINGQYWQSSHFSKEYIMFLEFIPKKFWVNEFIKQNNLINDSIINDEFIESKPNWFKPSKGSKKYKISSDFDQGSRYFKDLKTGICFFYEIQL